MLAENSAIIATSPFVIFLDIAGTIYEQPPGNSIQRKVEELFPGIDRCATYGNRVCSIAASHFFDKKSLENLDRIIDAIGKTRKVSIVISSNWRTNQSLKDLKTTFFGIHNFSKYIIDKTPDEVPKNEMTEYCLKGHSYSCRAAEIQYWLKHHPEVIDYLILDDVDNDLTSNFEERFFKINSEYLLSDEITVKILAWFKFG